MAETQRQKWTEKKMQVKNENLQSLQMEKGEKMYLLFIKKNLNKL